MKKNIGAPESIIRLTITVILTVLFLFNIFSFALSIILLMIGVVLLTTSLTQFSPLYHLFGISTLNNKRKA